LRFKVPLTMKNILAICGSIKARSSQQLYLNALEKLLPEDYKLSRYPSISILPHFNPDLNLQTVPPEVEKIRKQIVQADGVLICTPEYAMGIPGSLKNVLDWSVSSASFSKKPVLALVASVQGEKAYQSLIDVLTVIEVKVSPLLISFAKSKIN